MSYNAFIFDCDGTILDTLPDLVALTNGVLRELGYPEHTASEIKSYVGGGAARLIEQATPESATAEQNAAALKRWRESYPEYGIRLTRPYEGIPEALQALKAEGVRLAVLSNKFDAATKDVCERFFPDIFGIVHGESEDIPRKPNPRGLLRTIDELGATKETAIYVGDSSVDAQVAQNAGCLGVCVSWGYNPVEELLAAGAAKIISSPDELLTLL